MQISIYILDFFSNSFDAAFHVEVTNDFWEKLRDYYEKWKEQYHCPKKVFNLQGNQIEIENYIKCTRLTHFLFETVTLFSGLSSQELKEEFREDMETSTYAALAFLNTLPKGIGYERFYISIV